MIIVNVHKGLGNQLFHYAAGRYIALKEETNLLIDPVSGKADHESFLLKKYFNIKGVVLPEIGLKIIKKTFHFKLYENWNFGFDNNFKELKDFTYLLGNFQSRLYFESILQNLKKELKLKPRIENQIQKKLASYLELIQSSNSVCVHVRQGDYIQRGYILCGTTYYKNSFEFIKKRLIIPNSLFFLMKSRKPVQSSQKRKMQFL